ncbi:MAG: serine hydrolase domain-containing protein [Candidatus Thorarchaeota archaeon]|jgi:CubicO group peptidase (beta-lactamase class C family)
MKNAWQKFLDGIVKTHENVHNAVLLVESPHHKWKCASGMADPAENSPMMADDQFFTASVAKTMTASLVMMLNEKGIVHVDQTISQYLPSSIIDGLHLYEDHSYGTSITIRQLLNHTSGLGDNWSDPRFIQQILEDTERFWHPEETIEFVKTNVPPLFPPGQGFHYSDINYNLLGLIIERVTSIPLHEVYRKFLLDELGMNHTYRPFYEEPRPSIHGRPPSHFFAGDLDCTGMISLSADWGGGGLQTTTEDLNRFIRAFGKNELFEDPSTRDEMIKGEKIGEGMYYGLGVVRGVFDELDVQNITGEIWGHQGASASFMYYWKDEAISICGTLNQDQCEEEIGDIVKELMLIYKENY